MRTRSSMLTSPRPCPFARLPVSSKPLAVVADRQLNAAGRPGKFHADVSCV